MTPCPPDSQLSAYLADALDGAQGATVEAHSHLCERCQSRLAELSGCGVHYPARTQPGWRVPSGLLAGLAAASDPGEVAVADPSDTAESLPTIPGLELLRELGRGGMGVVYEARDTALGRRVAVKLLRPEVRDAGLVARFRREAEAVARLTHPNVVPIHAVGEWAGRPYLVLELVPGGTLADRLADGPLAPNLAAAVVEPIARAIEYTHRAGVIHRDLKPGNILLATGTGSGGFGSTVEVLKGRTDADLLPAPDSPPTALIPKVTDFGLARLTEVPAAFTRTGVVMGTPNYMAPEQARGNPQDVTESADVYALGAILYETLTGRPPFAGPTAVDTLFAVVSTDPVPPRRLNPAVPRDLETVALKCLEKVPHRRYPSAEAVADDLARFLRREPIRARPLSPLGRGLKWAQRKPWVAGLSAGLTAVMLASVVVFAALWLAASRAEGQARDEEGKAKGANAELAKELATGRTREYARLIALAAQYLHSGAAQDAARVLDECPPEHRGVEWRMLSDWAAHATRQLELPPATSRLLAADSVGGRLAVLQWEPQPNRDPALRERLPPQVGGRLHLFRAAAGRPPYASVAVPDGELFGVRFLTGDRLVEIRTGRTRRVIYDAETAERVYEIDGETVTVIPRGGAAPPVAVTLGQVGGRLLVWQLSVDPRTITLPLPDGVYYSDTQIALSPDGEWLAIVVHEPKPGTTPSRVLVGTANGSVPLTALPGSFTADTVTRPVFSPDSTTLAVTDRDRILRLFAVRTVSAVGLLRCGDLPDPIPLAFGPNNRVLAVGSKLKPVVEMWTSEAGPAAPLAQRWARARMVQRWQLDPVDANRKRNWDRWVALFQADGRFVEWTPDGRGTVWNQPLGPARTFNAEEPDLLRPHTSHPEPPPFSTVAVLADGSRFASARDLVAKLFDLPTSQARWESRPSCASPLPITAIQFSPDKKWVVLLRQIWGPGAVGERGLIEVMDAATGRLEKSIPVLLGRCRSLAVTADRVLIVTAPGAVRAWSLSADHRGDDPVDAWQVPVAPTGRAVFSADASALFLADSSQPDDEVKLIRYDLRTRAVTAAVPLPNWHGGISDLLPVGKDHLLVAGENGAAGLQLRAIETGRLVRTFPVGVKAGGASATDDGRRILTLSGTHLRLWDVETGYELCSLPDVPGDVFGAGMSGDGRLIVAHGTYGTVRVWRLGD